MKFFLPLFACLVLLAHTVQGSARANEVQAGCMFEKVCMKDQNAIKEDWISTFKKIGLRISVFNNYAGEGSWFKGKEPCVDIDSFVETVYENDHPDEKVPTCSTDGVFCLQVTKSDCFKMGVRRLGMPVDKPEEECVHQDSLERLFENRAVPEFKALAEQNTNISPECRETIRNGFCKVTAKFCQ